jgi:tetratricopeptide (TPR) repeat protein
METQYKVTHAGTGAPPPSQSAVVNAELQKILRSEPFQRSPRLSKLLSLIVEHALLGNAGHIKESTLAVMVFGRHASSFDVQRDPIVRVGAARLRNKLARYYASEGADTQMHITIPKGHYRPVFRESSGAEPVEEGDSIILRDRRRGGTSTTRRTSDRAVPQSGGRARNHQAQDCYELGRYAAQHRDPIKAIELFRRSIAFDDCFAPAHAALATALLNGAALASGPSKTFATVARNAALRALQLDDGVGDAYAVLATLKHRIDRDWASAEPKFAKALEVTPASPVCHLAFGRALSARGRHREAVNHMLRARELDPLNMDARVALAQAMSYGRLHTDAVSQLTSVLEIAPHYAHAEISLGFAHLYSNEPRLARQAFSRAATLLPANPGPRICAAAAWALEGRTAEARTLVSRVLERGGEAHYHSRYHLAIAHAYFADHDEVGRDLADAAARNDYLLANLPVEPAFGIYHGDPRFRTALEAFGLQDADDCPGPPFDRALRH